MQELHPCLVVCCIRLAVFATLHFDVHTYICVITSLFSLPPSSFISSPSLPCPLSLLLPFLHSSLLLLPLSHPSFLSLPLHTTGDNPDLAPVQPTGTPPIFFDTQSSDPWEFSLNLSAVAPTNTTQLRPNASAPVIHGFVLQIIVEQNGMNTTHNFYMVGMQEGGCCLCSMKDPFCFCVLLTDVCRSWSLCRRCVFVRSV